MHIFIFWFDGDGFGVNQENCEDVLLEEGLEGVLGDGYLHVELLGLIVILGGGGFEVDLGDGLENEEEVVLEGGEGVDDFHVEDELAGKREAAKMIHF